MIPRRTQTYTFIDTKHLGMKSNKDDAICKDVLVNHVGNVVLTLVTEVETATSSYSYLLL